MATCSKSESLQGCAALRESHVPGREHGGCKGPGVGTRLAFLKEDFNSVIEKREVRVKLRGLVN